MPRDEELRSILILGAGAIVIGQACKIGMGRPNVGDAISNEEVIGFAAGAVRLARLELGRTKCTDKDFGHIEFITLRY